MTKWNNFIHISMCTSSRSFHRSFELVNTAAAPFPSATSTAPSKVRDIEREFTGKQHIDYKPSKRT